jgi:hypothetical protein
MSKVAKVVGVTLRGARLGQSLFGPTLEYTTSTSVLLLLLLVRVQLYSHAGFDYSLIRASGYCVIVLKHYLSVDLVHF